MNTPPSSSPLHRMIALPKLGFHKTEQKCREIKRENNVKKEEGLTKGEAADSVRHGIVRGSRNRRLSRKQEKG